MFGNTQNAAQTNGKKTLFTKARKLMLGAGGIAVAACLMGASPAQARDRFDDHRDFVVRHEVRVFVPARYELRTRFDHGCRITERVVIEAGHWIIR